MLVITSGLLYAPLFRPFDGLDHLVDQAELIAIVRPLERQTDDDLMGGRVRTVRVVHARFNRDRSDPS